MRFNTKILPFELNVIIYLVCIILFLQYFLDIFHMIDFLEKHYMQMPTLFFESSVDTLLIWNHKEVDGTSCEHLIMSWGV